MSEFDNVVALCKGSVILTVNGHRDVFEERERYLLRDGSLSRAEVARLMAASDLYELRFHPRTPVGFYKVFGVSVDDVVSQAVGLLATLDRKNNANRD